MQTLFLILLLFLVSIFSVLLYFKTKKNRLALLNSGECPTCKEKKRIFTDKNTNTTFTQEVISARILKNHGCSGVIEMEFTCKNCGLKEVHSINSTSCGL